MQLISTVCTPFRKAWNASSGRKSQPCIQVEQVFQHEMLKWYWILQSNPQIYFNPLALHLCNLLLQSYAKHQLFPLAREAQWNYIYVLKLGLFLNQYSNCFSLKIPTDAGLAKSLTTEINMQVKTLKCCGCRVVWLLSGSQRDVIMYAELVYQLRVLIQNRGNE